MAEIKKLSKRGQEALVDLVDVAAIGRSQVKKEYFKDWLHDVFRTKLLAHFPELEEKE